MSQAFRILTDLTKKPDLNQLPETFQVTLQRGDGDRQALGFPRGWAAPSAADLIEYGVWGQGTPFTFRTHDQAMTTVEALIKKFSDLNPKGPLVVINDYQVQGKKYRLSIVGILRHEFEAMAFGNE